MHFILCFGKLSVDEPEKALFDLGTSKQMYHLMSLITPYLTTHQPKHSAGF